jgi:hypothetical protein
MSTAALVKEIRKQGEMNKSGRGLVGESLAGKKE